MKFPKRPLDRNKLIAIVAAMLIMVVGYLFIQSQASGFFATINPASSTLNGNAKLVTESDGSKTIHFNAPPATPSPTTPPPSASPVTPPSGPTSCPLPKYPDETCTGLLGVGIVIPTDPSKPSPLPKVSGMTIKTAGTVIEGKDIQGCVVVQAPNVTIRKSRINCTSIYGVASYGDTDHGGLLIEDTDIFCHNTNTTGVSYIGATIRRVHIKGCENGLHIDRNVTLVDSFIHEIYEGDHGHGDGIQSPDGSNSVIDHNTIYSESTTSSININHNASGPTSSNITISNNLLAGGAYTMYCPITPTVNYRILNNHFSTKFHPKSGVFGPHADCGNENQISGNIWHESGAAMTL